MSVIIPREAAAVNEEAFASLEALDWRSENVSDTSFGLDELRCARILFQLSAET